MSEYPIDDDWLRLLGWIYTDGSVLCNGNRICIYQTKQRGITEIERILSILKLEYSKYGPYKRNYMYYIHAKYSREVNEMLCFNGKKVLAPWLDFCSKRQMIILLRSIIDGDGTRRKYDTTIYGIKDRLAPLEILLKNRDISCKLWQNTRGDWLLQIHQKQGI